MGSNNRSGFVTDTCAPPPPLSGPCLLIPFFLENRKEVMASRGGAAYVVTARSGARSRAFRVFRALLPSCVSRGAVAACGEISLRGGKFGHLT